MLGTIISLAGTALSLWGAQQQASAAEDQASAQAAENRRVAAFNKKLSYYDASVAEEEGLKIFARTQVQIGNTRRSLDALLGTQMSRYAKSGVALGTGTPLDVAAETGKVVARDIEMIKNQGRTGMQRAQSLASRYRMLGDEGFRDAMMTAGMIESAGADRAMAYRVSGAGQALTSISNQGYFS